MVFDTSLVALLEEKDRAYWAGLVPAARACDFVVGEPLLELEDGFAFFAGEGSPLTQAGGGFSMESIHQIQRFYEGRTSEWEASIKPHDGIEALARLMDLGARLNGWESTLWRSYQDPIHSVDLPPQCEIVDGSGSNLAAWSETATRGFCSGEVPPVMLELGRLMELATHFRRYLVLWEGQPAAAATLTLGQGAAFLGGMSTLPQFRNRGIQTALIRQRLLDAKEESKIAIMGAAPGSSSHRNAERAGFRLAFNQLSLMVPTKPA